MDKFRETSSLPRLSQEETENLNRLITSTEIEFFKIPENRSSDDFTREFYQTYREELISILCKLFQKIEEASTLPNPFYEVMFTPILKQDRHYKKLR